MNLGLFICVFLALITTCFSYPRGDYYNDDNEDIAERSEGEYDDPELDYQVEDSKDYGNDVNDADDTDEDYSEDGNDITDDESGTKGDASNDDEPLDIDSSLPESDLSQVLLSEDNDLNGRSANTPEPNDSDTDVDDEIDDSELTNEMGVDDPPIADETAMVEEPDSPPEEIDDETEQGDDSILSDADNRNDSLVIETALPVPDMTELMNPDANSIGSNSEHFSFDGNEGMQDFLNVVDGEDGQKSETSSEISRAELTVVTDLPNEFPTTEEGPFVTGEIVEEDTFAPTEVTQPSDDRKPEEDEDFLDISFSLDNPDGDNNLDDPVDAATESIGFAEYYQGETTTISEEDPNIVDTTFSSDNPGEDDRSIEIQTNNPDTDDISDATEQSINDKPEEEVQDQTSQEAGTRAKFEKNQFLAEETSEKMNAVVSGKDSDAENVFSNAENESESFVIDTSLPIPDVTEVLKSEANAISSFAILFEVYENEDIEDILETVGTTEYPPEFTDSPEAVVNRFTDDPKLDETTTETSAFATGPTIAEEEVDELTTVSTDKMNTTPDHEDLKEIEELLDTKSESELDDPNEAQTEKISAAAYYQGEMTTTQVPPNKIHDKPKSQTPQLDQHDNPKPELQYQTPQYHPTTAKTPVRKSKSAPGPSEPVSSGGQKTKTNMMQRNRRKTHMPSEEEEEDSFWNDDKPKPNSQRRSRVKREDVPDQPPTGMSSRSPDEDEMDPTTNTVTDVEHLEEETESPGTSSMEDEPDESRTTEAELDSSPITAPTAEAPDLEEGVVPDEDGALFSNDSMISTPPKSITKEMPEDLFDEGTRTEDHKQQESHDSDSSSKKLDDESSGELGDGTKWQQSSNGTAKANSYADQEDKKDTEELESTGLDSQGRTNSFKSKKNVRERRQKLGSQSSSHSSSVTKITGGKKKKKKKAA